MAEYKVTSPEGTEYKVTAPNGATQDEILQRVREQHAPGFSAVPAIPGIDKDYQSPADPTQQLKIPGIDTGKKEQQPDSSVGEYLKSIPTGIAKTAADYASSEQIEEEQRAIPFGKSTMPKVPTGDDLVQAFNLHNPKGFWGEAGQLTGEFAVNPLTYFGPGSAITKFLTTTGAILGGSAGKEIGGAKGELIGAMAGGAASPLVLKAITPIVMSQARQAATQLLETEGVTGITAGQRTGNRALEYWEGYLGNAPLGGAKATASRDLSGRQFTAAVLRRVGVNADLATTNVINDAFTRIGSQMDAIAARNTVRLDNRFAQQLQMVGNDYNMTVPTGSVRSVIGKTIDDLLDKAKTTPVLSGEIIQRFRSRLLRLQRGAFNDPEYSSALGGIVEAIDGAAQRSISNPADLAAWRLARRQYRNLLTIAQSATGAGEQSAEGIITPARLRQALTSSQRGRRDYARGRGDFSALSHAGNLLMTPLPDSGTGQRWMARAFALSLLASAGYFFRGGEDAAAGGALLTDAFGPGLAGRVVMAKPVQSYLSGQLLGQKAAAQAQKQFAPLRWTAARVAAPVLMDNPPDSLFNQNDTGPFGTLGDGATPKVPVSSQ